MIEGRRQGSSCGEPQSGRADHHRAIYRLVDANDGHFRLVDDRRGLTIPPILPRLVMVMVDPLSSSRACAAIPRGGRYPANFSGKVVPGYGLRQCFTTGTFRPSAGLCGDAQVHAVVTHDDISFRCRSERCIGESLFRTRTRARPMKTSGVRPGSLLRLAWQFRFCLSDSSAVRSTSST